MLACSSPVTGTRRERALKSRAKGLKKRAVTVAKQEAAEEETEQQWTAQAAIAKSKALGEVLTLLTTKGLSWGDLMTHVFNPRFMQGAHQWEGFMKSEGSVTRILKHWVSPQYSVTTRNEVRQWAEDVVAKTISKDEKAVNNDGFLCSHKQDLSSKTILDFSMSTLHEKLTRMAQVVMCMFATFATSP